MNPDRIKLVEQAVARLGEHFTSVHIMVSCQEDGGTSSCHRGTGDWYARQGLAHEFINTSIHTDAAVKIAEELKREPGAEV